MGTSQKPLPVVCGPTIAHPWVASFSLFCDISTRRLPIGLDGTGVGIFSYAASISSLLLRPRFSLRASISPASIPTYFPLHFPSSHSGLSRYVVGCPHVGQYGFSAFPSTWASNFGEGFNQTLKTAPKRTEECPTSSYVMNKPRRSRCQATSVTFFKYSITASGELNILVPFRDTTRKDLGLKDCTRPKPGKRPLPRLRVFQRVRLATGSCHSCSIPRIKPHCL